LYQKVRVGAVNYLNTKPLVYGFEQGEMAEELELVMDYPANIATNLLNGSLDIGLVPVAVLPKMESFHIISDYCIGCNGAVASVCLFSEVPIEEVTTVLLDYQSRTSVALLKLLLKEYWKKEVVFEPATGDFYNRVKDRAAALVIGDRALALNNRFGYVFDLGQAWKEHTGMPFVFAVWAATNLPGAQFVQQFNKSCSIGFQHLPTIIQQANVPPHYPGLEKYYSENICYEFGAAQKEAMNFFLGKLGEYNI
jgi:chorismate dehydratase